jgi:hypothetical protein
LFDLGVLYRHLGAASCNLVQLGTAWLYLASLQSFFRHGRHHQKVASVVVQSYGVFISHVLHLTILQLSNMLQHAATRGLGISRSASAQHLSAT